MMVMGYHSETISKAWISAFFCKTCLGHDISSQKKNTDWHSYVSAFVWVLFLYGFKKTALSTLHNKIQV